MMNFKQYLKARSAPCTTEKLKEPGKHKTILQEGISLDPTDLIDELTALGAKSLFAKVIADNDDEVTLHLTVKKWRIGNYQERRVNGEGEYS